MAACWNCDDEVEDVNGVYYCRACDVLHSPDPYVSAIMTGPYPEGSRYIDHGAVHAPCP